MPATTKWSRGIGFRHSGTKNDDRLKTNERLDWSKEPSKSQNAAFAISNSMFSDTMIFPAPAHVLLRPEMDDNHASCKTCTTTLGACHGFVMLKKTNVSLPLRVPGEMHCGQKLARRADENATPEESCPNMPNPNFMRDFCRKQKAGNIFEVKVSESAARARRTPGSTQGPCFFPAGTPSMYTLTLWAIVRKSRLKPVQISKL